MEAHLLALATDLFFAPALKGMAEKQAMPLEWIESPLPLADLLTRLHNRPPVLIILDLNTILPWRDWLLAAKADPRTAAIPWFAYGSHKDARTLAAARRLGADKVVPRSALAAELSAWLGKLDHF